MDLNLAGKKVLVTGSSGFIGSHVVRLFLNKYPGVYSTVISHTAVFYDTVVCSVCSMYCMSKSS